jgi:hypothetical protein
VRAALGHAHQSCAPLCVRLVASTSPDQVAQTSVAQMSQLTPHLVRCWHQKTVGPNDLTTPTAGRVGCQLSVGRRHWCRAVGTDDPQVADNESTAVGWFEADALPTPLMKSAHAGIAHAMAYRSHPENGIWFACP